MPSSRPYVVSALLAILVIASSAISDGSRLQNGILGQADVSGKINFMPEKPFPINFQPSDPHFPRRRSTRETSNSRSGTEGIHHLTPPHVERRNSGGVSKALRNTNQEANSLTNLQAIKGTKLRPSQNKKTNLQ